jgi:hypothetical protein
MAGRIKIVRVLGNPTRKRKRIKKRKAKRKAPRRRTAKRTTKFLVQALVTQRSGAIRFFYLRQNKFVSARSRAQRFGSSREAHQHMEAGRPAAIVRGFHCLQVVAA